MDYFQPFSSYIPQVPQQKTHEQQQQDALIEALRGFGQQQSAAPQQAGQVVNANFSGGFQQGAGMGAQMGQAGQGLWNKYQPMTALQYGTTPGSQQTAMLTAQDAGF